MDQTAGSPPDHVLVVGGGTMGAGIVQTFLEHGYQVTLKELDEAAATKARSTVHNGVERWARRLEDDDAGRRALARFSATSDLDGFAGLDVSLVIESVPEQESLKRAVLGELAERFPASVLASNTSALSINTLSRAVRRPERFMGMHFFNPVPRSTLIELVRGSQTSAEIVDRCRRHAERLEKVSIEVNDAPGFATSRLGIAIGLEAIRMVAEGVASVEDIDLGMVHGYKFPIGPLALSDMVGLDVRLAIADNLSRELGDRFEAPDLLRELVARGDLGAKTGRGFYEWQADGRRVSVSPNPEKTENSEDRT